MLLLASLSCICNFLVQFADAIIKSFNLSLQVGDAFLLIRDGSLKVRSLIRQNLGFVLSLVKLGIAIILLQLDNKFINELDDLLEASLASTQCNFQEIHTRISALTQSAQHIQGLGCHCLGADRDLQQAGAASWQSLFEQLKSIVIIQDLDGVCQGQQLLTLHFLVCCPLLLLVCTVHIQICEELLALSQVFLGVFQVICHLCNFYAQLPNTGHLGLNGGLEGIDLLVLGRLQFLKSCNCSILISCALCEVSHHFIVHGLQNAHNLSTCWGVTSLCRQERCEHLTVDIAHVHVD